MNGASRSKSLAEVLGNGFKVDVGVRVSDLTLDSRSVQPGAAFLACQGRSQHGLRHVGAAVAAGARAVLWEPAAGVAPPQLDASVLVVAVPGLGAQAGLLADRFFDQPSAALAIAGVTGTNGKTTCAWLLAQALELLGTKAAYFGTLGQGAVDALQATGLTTADAVSLQRALRAAVDAGTRAVAMEVSSHALDQHRTAGVRFSFAAFTNLSRDHLDYHASMAAYGAAKARLFALSGLQACVINADDAYAPELLVSAAPAARLILTSRRANRLPGPAHAWLGAAAVDATGAGLQLTIEGSFGQCALHSSLLGDFNADNLLTVLALLLAFGHPLAAAAAALARCEAAPGRMEASGGGRLPLVIVDYAHTPDALARALAAARQHTRGRLWCVFGCGGDRDAGKRPLMGQIASELADRVIVTDDNPRTEDPAEISAAIVAGGDMARIEVIHERGAAIAAALHRAVPGDTVLIAGKGHERDQVVGTERRPFHDASVVRAQLQQWGSA
jgi:UDP-N-acetylmuramoyl-L-alanyl-D-glutamate--2,6-diaminopimelate ligase